MPNPRTPAPSRIGKTLDAILSAPRRGAPDADDALESPIEPVEPAGGAAAVAPAPERAVLPVAAAPAAASAPGQAARDEGADAATAGRAVSVAQTPPAASTPAFSPADAAPVTIKDDEDPGSSRGSRRKKRETFLVPEDLADAMRNAIVHLSGPPLYYTLAEFGEHAIRGYIAQLEREHNAGRPFPPRPRAVRQGRPLR